MLGPWKPQPLAMGASAMRGQSVPRPRRPFRSVAMASSGVLRLTIAAASLTGLATAFTTTARSLVDARRLPQMPQEHRGAS
eukprot:Skav208265  [mRNA]  locus=scaffold188:198160:199664:+ [translate_table: standard]